MGRSGVSLMRVVATLSQRCSCRGLCEPSQSDMSYLWRGVFGGQGRRLLLRRNVSAAGEASKERTYEDLK